VNTRNLAPNAERRQDFNDAANAPAGAHQEGNRSREHASDDLHLLERFRQANKNDEYPSTAQLQREALFGLRPVNRIGDLRKGKNLPTYYDIQRIKCPRGVFRWKLHEPARPLEKQEWRYQGRASQLYLSEHASTDWRDRPRATGLPFWDSSR
jgi:hypothetical protein